MNNGRRKFLLTVARSTAVVAAPAIITSKMFQGSTEVWKPVQFIQYPGVGPWHDHIITPDEPLGDYNPYEPTHGADAMRYAVKYFNDYHCPPQV
jgi:hypothetical protein